MELGSAVIGDAGDAGIACALLQMRSMMIAGAIPAAAHMVIRA